jgi:hypothetical protein
MMAGMFDIKFPDFKKMFKELERISIQAATASINDLAVEARKISFDTLDEEYLIRSPQFVKLRLKVGKKARPSEDIDRMNAEVGSTFFHGFTGWEEPAGKPDRRTKTITLNARGGNPRAIIPPKNRYRKNQHYVTSDDFAYLPEASRFAATISAALRANPEARIRLNGGGFPNGLYAPTGEIKISPKTGRLLPRVAAVQLLDRKPREEKSFDWMLKTLETIGPDFIKKAFQKNSAFYANRARRKK